MDVETGTVDCPSSNFPLWLSWRMLDGWKQWKDKHGYGRLSLDFKIPGINGVMFRLSFTKLSRPVFGTLLPIEDKCKTIHGTCT